MDREALVRAADAILEALSDLGVPFAGPARSAVHALDSLRRADEARRRLEELLQKAREDFKVRARQEGLEEVAQWVASLPIADLPTFRQALQALLQQSDERDLLHKLEQELKRVPGLDEARRARALALLMDCLRARLSSDEQFRPVITALSVLRTEKQLQALQSAVDRLQEAVNALLGLPEDVLVWPVRRLDEPIAELRAYHLHPKYRLVPYTGVAFEGMRDDLIEWARGLEKAQSPVGLRLYVGPGGAGKTRLLIEAGEALRAEGWWVGFLRAGRLTPNNAPILCRDARPTLLIIDYVADRSEEVRILLRAAARALRERTAPLAIVLLERSLPPWLEKELSTYVDPDYVNWPEFLSLPTVEKAPRELPSVEEVDRSAFFESALQRFRELCPIDPQKPIPRYALAELPESPLHILLLAMLTVEGVQVDQAARPEQVLEYAWSRERSAWERHLRPLIGPIEEWLGEAVERVEDLCVVATLGRRFPSPEAIEAFLREHAEPLPNIRWKDLAQRLLHIFPHAEDGMVPPIVPDPLADFVVAQRLKERPELLRWALPTHEEAERAPEEAARAARQALSVLARIWEQNEEQAEKWMKEVADHVVAWPLIAWSELETLLPNPVYTLALREFLAAFYRGRLDQVFLDEERARIWNNLAAALYALGCREETLQAAQEAVALYRRLAERDPNAFLPNLAKSLNNLGLVLAGLGRREEALQAAQEAVALYRQLAQQHPDAFLPDLAMSLNNLGNRLANLGRREEALQATQEAVQIRRQLAAQHPDAFLPHLAMSLSNLGLVLAGLGRREEALQAAQEAVTLYRRLAQQHPDAFLPDLAMSLSNLGAALVDLGRREEALQAMQEAAALYRRLAQQHPDAFLPDLAMSLNNLGAMLVALGRREEALQAAHEAVQIRRQLAKQRPNAFLPDLARSLATYGFVLMKLGRAREAHAAFAEALQQILPLARAYPAVFGELADALRTAYLQTCRATRQEPDRELIE
ncbi:tetratricopeptide repeat protein [Thermoflexus sp.]|uniref:tetratricopeptide repeat protein n=1 Tax=Thermoflexus sp. TaxID=1969742 RepID=UPI0026029AE4|nr:tetratricopeptide repeat protein [Thermoflexus sp.]MCX7689769.1 tetratricopeptide repeat protein [Thermoflexus sp.]